MGERKSTILQIPPLPPTPNTRFRNDSCRSGFRGELARKYFADIHAISSFLLPLVQCQSVRFKQRPNLSRSPVKKLIENGHHDAERVVAEHRALSRSEEHTSELQSLRH